MMRTPRFRLVALGALLTAAGCAETDRGADAPDVEQAPPGSSVLTLAEFTAAFDPVTGEIGLELLPVDEWEVPPTRSGEFATVPQALWCTLSDATVGGMVALTTVVDSVGRTPEACDLPNGGPFSSWGAFCADVTVRSRATSAIIRPMAEITSVDAGYEGYRFVETGGHYGVDPATLDGPNPPSELKGLFGYPDLDVGESATSTWAFHNAGGAFSFRGRIVAEAYEECNGVDDDCDGVVDDGVGCFSANHACASDFDCASGNCTTGGTCGPSQCEDRIWNGSETDIDCGGPCQPCLDGADCIEDTDCRSNNCRVDRCVPYRYPMVGEVVITEVMVDPGATGDQDMEWFEIRSIAGQSLDLDGCRIADSSGAATVLTGLTIDAGQHQVFAHSLVPSDAEHDAAWAVHRAALPADTVMYDGFTFGNASDTVVLSCPLDGTTDTVIDALAWGAGLATDRKAIQLHPNTTTAAANDTAVALCDARQTYVTGFTGTPGAPNPSCDVALTACVFAGPFDVDAPLGQPLRYFGRVRAFGLTDVTSGTDRAPARFYGQVGFGPDGSTPSTAAGWVWTSATPNPAWSDPTGLGYDESSVTVTPDLVVGQERDVAFRWTGNGGTSWLYCTGKGDLTVMEPASAPVVQGDAVFSEVMADPNGSDAVGEWFEIANPSGVPVDLAGCRVSDGVSLHTIASSVFIPVGGVALFALEAGSASNLTGVDYEYSGLVLANRGRTLTLECRADSASPWVVVDRTEYAENDVVTGVSLQLDPIAAAPESNDLPGSWCLAAVTPTFGPAPGQRGSPGTTNTACYTIGSCRVQRPTTLLSLSPTARPTVFGRVFVDRLTNRTGGIDTAPAVVAQVGVGNDGTAPADHFSWQWTTASPAEGYGPATAGYEADRDEYEAAIAVPPGSGPWDVAYRFSANGGTTWTYCDLDKRGTGGGDGSTNGYAAADSVPMTTAPTQVIGSCNLQFPQDIDEAWAGDALTVYGRLFVAGLTELPGPNPAPTIVGQHGYGPDGAAPATWPAANWVTATTNAACVDCGNSDEYQATFIVPTAGDGPYDHAYRFSGDGGVTWTYCDRNGGAYEPAEAGHLAPLAWIPEYCHLGWDDAAITGRRGEPVAIDGFVFAWSDLNGEPGPQCDPDGECLTTRTGNTDPAADLFGEFGWGTGGDPTVWTTWTSASAAPAASYGPTSADYEAGNDKYTATIGLPAEGTWESAFRFTGDGGRTWTYCGANGVWTDVGDPLGSITTLDAVRLPYSETFTGTAGQGFRVTTPGVFDVDTSLVPWTVDLDLATPSSTDTRGLVDGVDTRFELQDVDGYAIWASPVIDISAATTVRADVVLSEPNVLEARDGVMVGYRLDGGGFYLRELAFDDFASLTDTYFASGETLQVVVVFASDSVSDDLYLESVTVAAAASPAPSPTEIALPFHESFPVDGAYAGALGAVTQEGIGGETLGECNVVGGALEGENLNGICTYRSRRLDVLGAGPVYISVDVDSFGVMEPDDGVMIGYVVDNRIVGIASWSGLGNSLFALTGASEFEPTTVTGGGVEGRAFEVVVVMMNDAPGEGFRVDDIRVCAGAPCPDL